MSTTDTLGGRLPPARSASVMRSEVNPAASSSADGPVPAVGFASDADITVPFAWRPHRAGGPRRSAGEPRTLLILCAPLGGPAGNLLVSDPGSPADRDKSAMSLREGHAGARCDARRDLAGATDQ